MDSRPPLSAYSGAIMIFIMQLRMLLQMKRGVNVTWLPFCGLLGLLCFIYEIKIRNHDLLAWF